MYIFRAKLEELSDEQVSISVALVSWGAWLKETETEFNRSVDYGADDLLWCISVHYNGALAGCSAAVLSIALKEAA